MIQSSRSPKKGKLEIPTERINRFFKKKIVFKFHLLKKQKKKLYKIQSLTNSLFYRNIKLRVTKENSNN